MKRTIFPLLLFVVVGLASCGPKKDPNLTYFDKANEYNDYIINEQVAVFDAYDELVDEMSYGTESSIDESLTSFKKRTTEALDKMNKLADFKKNVEFRDAAKSLFQFYADACDKELKDLAVIFSKGEGIDEADYDRVDELTTKMDDEEQSRNNKLIEAQQVFAKKNNLSLY